VLHRHPDAGDTECPGFDQRTDSDEAPDERREQPVATVSSIRRCAESLNEESLSPRDSSGNGLHLPPPAPTAGHCVQR